jgi:hypothetical protein
MGTPVIDGVDRSVGPSCQCAVAQGHRRRRDRNSGWCLVSRDGETAAELPFKYDDGSTPCPALRLLRYPNPRADCQLMPSVLDLDLELHCACVLHT